MTSAVKVYTVTFEKHVKSLSLKLYVLVHVYDFKS